MNRTLVDPDRQRRAVRGIHPLSVSAVGQEPAALDFRRAFSRALLPVARCGGDASSQQTECLIHGNAQHDVRGCRFASCT